RVRCRMIHDKKLFGVCVRGDLFGFDFHVAKLSFQVYEYFISYHMAKAFESLFGSVTCLPGCFTLYRLR
ncbi:chitin synthase-domain-containing protein, partial [Hygrophoropsis aurantiaca]